MVTRPITIGDATTRQQVPANLLVGVDDLALVRAELLWSPFRLRTIERFLLGGRIGPLPQHVHWNWAVKVLGANQPSENCAVERSGRTEGFATLITAGKTARLPAATGRPLVYVDYLETAPWNNPDITPTPEFRGIGLRLMQAAVQYSMDGGSDGRIGLHSLPQSASYYGGYCGMDSLGPDPQYMGLVYFELGAVNVAAFLAR